MDLGAYQRPNQNEKLIRYRVTKTLLINVFLLTGYLAINSNTDAQLQWICDLDQNIQD